MPQDLTDQLLLDALPSYIESDSSFLKATPATEGGDRFVYIEASNEKKDQQNEIVLSKALADSADYFLRFGNVDVDHITQIGMKRGIPNYESFEIGRPVEVRIEDKVTFVKAQIYKGEGPAAEMANMFWSSVTDIVPPKRWYPSVGGAVMGKEIVVDRDTGAKHAVITKVRWANLAVSRTPVNAEVATVSTAAFGPLAKSWGAMFKGLEAGGGSDSAALTGGAAMRVQSLDHAADHDADREFKEYEVFRNKFANALRAGELKEMSQSGLIKAAQQGFGLTRAKAARYVQWFLNDLQAALQKEKR